MTQRKATQIIRGQHAVDGAGVHLRRVVGLRNVHDFDPFLMLDGFDSLDPNDYIKGFPWHPHRGIETISLIVKGNMVHKDSLGNQDAISDREVQWMTAGSGILHEEMLPASERMLGVQLWLNMPAKDKMAKPAYQSIKRDKIEEIPIQGGTLRLVSGSYQGHTGFKGHYLPLDYYDIVLDSNQKFTIDTKMDQSVMVFLLTGNAKIAGELVKEKTAVKLSQGTSLTIESQDCAIEILFMSSEPLGESVAWGGPIVMNTQEELNTAFRELRDGTFLKDSMDYNK